MSKVPVYLVFGPQGSGKSTQAQLLSEHLKLPFFDSGANLRDLVNRNTEDSDKISKIMKSGKLVPNKLLRKIFDEFIAGHDTSNGMVTDGFPRNMKQVELFQTLAKDYSWQVVSFYVGISDATAKERLAKRYKLINGKKVFREDDKPNIVDKRLELFKDETVPVINWLRDNSTLYEIDGEPDKETVFKSIKSKIDIDEV